MWFLSVNGWCVCLKPVQLTNPREAENRMRKIFGLLSCLFSTVCRSKRRDILKRTELIVARCGHTFDARTRQGNSHTNTNTEDTVCEQWKLSVRHPLGRRTAGKGKECGWTTYTRAMWMMKKNKKMMEWSTALLLCHHMPDTNCGDDECRWVHVCVCVWWWWALRRTWLAPTWLPTSQLAELENCCFYFCYTRLKCLHIYIIFICSMLIPNRMPWQPCCLLVLNHLANLFRLIPLFTPKYEGIIYSMSLWSIF